MDNLDLPPERALALAEKNDNRLHVPGHNAGGAQPRDARRRRKVILKQSVPGHGGLSNYDSVRSAPLHGYNAPHASGWRALLTHWPNAERSAENAPTAAIRKPAAHDADFSLERIVALPDGDDDRRRVRLYGAAGAQPRDVDLEQIVLKCCRHLTGACAVSRYHKQVPTGSGAAISTEAPQYLAPLRSCRRVDRVRRPPARELG